MSQDLIQKAAELVVDMKEMADLHAGNGDTPAAEEFSQGADLVCAMAAEIVRLQAVEASVIAMTAMLNEREWAEHVGKGAASELESAITTLHNELAEAQKDAERFQFFAAVAVSDELHDAFEPHIPTDVETPEDIDGVRAHMDICIQSVKDADLWPIKAEPELTDEAQDDRDSFEAFKDELGGCRCHISPPCGYCTHPGNPANQEDPSCWKVAP